MREKCERCGFILERCLCDYLTPVHNKTTLIILQHPSEKKHALNTVRLMEKIFQKIHLYSGEHFGEEESLHQLLSARPTALLFPGPESVLLSKKEVCPFEQIILLDGTWKKAKKIYYLNSFLHSLPKIALRKETPSHYRIRQSALQDSLSTLEAAVSALEILEPGLDCSSAQNAFKAMIDFQIEKMGREVYEQNYKKRAMNNHRPSLLKT